MYYDVLFPKNSNINIMIREFIIFVYYKTLSICRIPYNIVYGNDISFRSNISNNCWIKHTKIGKYTFIARCNSLYNVEIGNYCCFGPDIHIGGMQHSYWWYSMSPLLSEECKLPDRTIIGNDVWIGAQAIIKQGVRIGDGAVIGANSFVNKDVEPFSIVVGSPAKHIKYRFEKDIQKAITESAYWNENPRRAKEILESLQLI